MLYKCHVFSVEETISKRKHIYIYNDYIEKLGTKTNLVLSIKIVIRSNRFRIKPGEDTRPIKAWMKWTKSCIFELREEKTEEEGKSRIIYRKT